MSALIPGSWSGYQHGRNPVRVLSSVQVINHVHRPCSSEDTHPPFVPVTVPRGVTAHRLPPNGPRRVLQERVRSVGTHARRRSLHRGALRRSGSVPSRSVACPACLLI